MKTGFSMINIRTAIRHPTLILKLLGNSEQNFLTQEHVRIHLNRLSKLKIEASDLEPIDKVCRAIQILSKSCYHTEYLYIVCKLFNPSNFVETGVQIGASSAFILKALENTAGKLYSIDLPNVKYHKDDGGNHVDSLPGNAKTGFVVPHYLKANWDLRLGDSRIELPKLLNSIDEIDIFHHDSMHTYDLMTFEFETALPKLKKGGLLLSDDANWNNAFKDFCDKHSLENRIYRHIGIAVKS